MHIIKLDAIDSTNSYLKTLSSSSVLEDFTVVTAKTQTQGRGQMGTHWQADSEKNLTMSVYKQFSGVALEQQFYISTATALAIVSTLSRFTIPRLFVKWPNDILSDTKKVCGILIENVIKQDTLVASVIGIGLNINQTEFKAVPNASSMRLINGTVFNVDEVLHTLLKELEKTYNRLENGDFLNLKKDYEKRLFRKNKPSTFKTAEGDLFSGFIECVTNSGNLQLRLEDNEIREFGLKDITLLY